jgi:hypothetical protein
MSEGLSASQFKGISYSIIGILTVGIAAVAVWAYKRSRQIKKITIVDIIGNTPLIYLPNLSKAAGCHIYVGNELGRLNWSI